MKITEIVPGHQFLKEWDQYEQNWWLDYAAFYNHLQDIGNPHMVKAPQVAIVANPVDPNTHLQAHVEDAARHTVWGGLGGVNSVVKTGAQVIATAGVIKLGNTKTTRGELLFIDGLLKVNPDEYIVQYFVGLETEVTILTPGPVVLSDLLHPDSVVQVLFEELL